jgi:hypothetical protein
MRSARVKKARSLYGLPADTGGKTVGIHVRHTRKPKAPPKPRVAATAKTGTTAKAAPKTKKTTGKRKGHPQSAATRAKISASLRARRARKSG